MPSGQISNTKIVLPKKDPAFIKVPAFGTKELFLGLDGELYTKDASNNIRTVSVTNTTFSTLGNIPASTNIIVTSGHSSIGVGAGTYISDSLATAELAATHPRFCKLSGDGRYFRLLPGTEGIAIEQAGGVGADTAAAAKLIDNRAAINAAVAYGIAIGCKTILLSKPHYAWWQDEKNDPQVSIHTDKSGLGIIIYGGHVEFRSTCTRTDLWRMAPGGADPAVWANWPLTDGGTDHWRGGGIFLQGENTYSGSQTVADEELSGVTLNGVWLQGGLLQSAGGPVNLSTGVGWDTTDKGIWCQNDRWVGDIRIINGGVIGFRGEIVYTGGNPERTLFVRNGTFGETAGQCINPNGYNIDIDGMYGFNANLPFEGWAGPNGRLINAYFTNCGSGPLAGGKFAAGTYSTYYAPSRVNSAVPPYFHIDVTFHNCGTVWLGSWARGRVELIDSRLAFDVASVFKDGLADVHLSEVIVVTDQETEAGLDFVGGNGTSSLSQGLYDVFIDKVRFVQSEDAIAAARLPGTPISWYNSIGPKVFIGDVSGYISTAPTNAAAAANYVPSFLDYHVQQASGTVTQNVQTTPAIPSYTGPRLLMTTTGTEVYNITLPTSNVNSGQILDLECSGPGIVAINGNPSSGSGFRNNNRSVYLPQNYRCRLKFDGWFWTLVEGGVLQLTGSATYNAPSIAAGSSTTTTVTVTGAALGDKVTAISLGVDILGLVCTGYVSATDTVTVVLFNPTVAAIDIASTTLRVEVSRK